MEEYEKSYNEFWKSIVEDENGKVDMNQVKKNLADYRDLLREVSKIHNELAGVSNY